MQTLLEQRLSELLGSGMSYSAAGQRAAPISLLVNTEQEVWYEYVNVDVSALAVTLPDAGQRISDADGERLVWRPGAGLDGWTPMREVLSARTNSSEIAVAAAGEQASDGDASGVGSGPVVGSPFRVSKWRPQFGLPLEACESTSVNGYAIPSILVLLWNTLKANGGHLEEGVFRLAANHAECKEIVSGLNTSGDALAQIGAHTSAHTLANLIKMWFRSLPDTAKLVTEDIIEQILAEGELESTDRQASGKACMELLKGFPPARQGLFLWLLELMADVAAQRSTNLMSEQNIAIVLAPNLYHGALSLAGGDPMKAVKAMANFVEKLLLYYVAVRHRIQKRGTSTGSEEPS